MTCLILLPELQCRQPEIRKTLPAPARKQFPTGAGSVLTTFSATERCGVHGNSAFKEWRKASEMERKRREISRNCVKNIFPPLCISQSKSLSVQPTASATLPAKPFWMCIAKADPSGIFLLWWAGRFLQAKRGRKTAWISYPFSIWCVCIKLLLLKSHRINDQEAVRSYTCFHKRNMWMMFQWL